MKKFYTTLIMMAFLISGCSTKHLYVGTPKQESEIVRIEGMGNGWILLGVQTTKVCTFDKKPLESCESSIAFLPGLHQLELVASDMGMTHGKKNIEHEFKAGDRFNLGIELRDGWFANPVLMYRGNINQVKP